MPIGKQGLTHQTCPEPGCTSRIGCPPPVELQPVGHWDGIERRELNLYLRQFENCEQVLATVIAAIKAQRLAHNLIIQTRSWGGTIEGFLVTLEDSLSKLPVCCKSERYARDMFNSVLLLQVNPNDICRKIAGAVADSIRRFPVDTWLDKRMSGFRYDPDLDDFVYATYLDYFPDKTG